jgi:hypothetical protein
MRLTTTSGQREKCRVPWSTERPRCALFLWRRKSSSTCLYHPSKLASITFGDQISFHRSRSTLALILISTPGCNLYLGARSVLPGREHGYHQPALKTTISTPCPASCPWENPFCVRACHCRHTSWCWPAQRPVGSRARRQQPCHGFAKSRRPRDLFALPNDIALCYDMP